MARRKKREGQSLHKVLGVPALFSTAYGNVGSSIYYALGVVAAVRPGPHAGGVHAHRPAVRHHRLQLRRSHHHVPGGGRLVELRAPHLQRVRQLRRRLGAHAGLHHHHRHLGVLRAQLPGRLLAHPQAVALQLHRRHRHHRLARHHQHRRHQRSRAPQHHPRDPGPGHAGAARSSSVCSCFSRPAILIHQIHLGVAPTWHQFIYGISIGTVAYTGIETICNMAEEAANPARDVPRAIKFVLVAVLGVYFGHLAGGPVGHARASTTCCPSNPATGKTVPGRRRSRRRARGRDRALRAAERPQPDRLRAGDTSETATAATSPRPPSPPAPSTRVDGQQVTNALRHASSASVYAARPGAGHRRITCRPASAG